MPSSVSWSVREDLESLSDHRITETEFFIDNDRILQGAPRKRWRHADWPQIEKALDRLQSHLVTPSAILNSASEAAFDSQMNALQIELSTAAAPHVPQGRPSSQRKHWWNEDVARAHSTLKKAKRKGERHRGTHGWLPDFLLAEIAAARSHLQSVIRGRKREAWKDFLADNSSTTRDLWSTYKRLTKPTGVEKIAFLTIGNGELVEDPSEISGLLFQKFFPSSPEPEAQRTYAVTCPPPHVSVAEARRAFEGGRSFAAPGPDGLPKALISRAFRKSPEVFAAIATRSLQLGFLPRTWQQSEIICIPKKANPRKELALLRPISLIGSIAKCVHQIVAQRLAQFLESKNGLSCRQFGFRVGRGVVDALVESTDFIERHTGIGRAVYGVTLDIKVAFDSIRPSATLDALERLDTPPYLMRWMQAFLSNREAKLDLERGSFSHAPSIGSPQGSPLSPLLFIIGMDPILELAQDTEALHIQAYVDDILVLSTAPTERSAQLKLQATLDRMNSWAQDRGLIFAPEKCFQIRFVKRR